MKTSQLKTTLVVLFFVTLSYQNCSRVGFSVLDRQEIKTAAVPECVEAIVSQVRCETEAGFGSNTCGPTGPKCEIETCRNPADQLVNGVCIGASTIAVDIDGKKHTTITPTKDSVLNIDGSATVVAAGINEAQTNIIRIGGTCARTEMTISDLSIIGGIRFGSQTFNYSEQLAAQIGGCTWKLTVEQSTGVKDSATFVAQLCEPLTVAPTNPACTTNDGRPGTRYCQADGLSFECRPNVVPQPEPERTCLFNGQVLALNQSIRAYATSSVQFGETCRDEVRTCTSSGLSGSFAFSQCSPLPPANCSLGGVTVNHGSQITAYANSEVGIDQTCQSEARVCNNGSLSGSYQHLACTARAARTCSVNGETLAHLESRNYFSRTSAPFGEACASQTRTCRDGVMSGSENFIYSFCQVQPPMNCQFDGRTVPHNSAVTAYASGMPPFGTSCTSEQRRCDNGVLSGSFTFAACAPGEPNTCNFNGQTLLHGAQVQAFQTSSVAFGQVCSAELRQCNNGLLSGSFQNTNCTVNDPANCTFGNRVISHGERVTAYGQQSVTYGSTCSSETRTCNNGQLSGSYWFESCTVQEPPQPPPPKVYTENEMMMCPKEGSLCSPPGWKPIMNNIYIVDTCGCVQHGTNPRRASYSAHCDASGKVVWVDNSRGRECL